jgi:hypothetical protein
MIATSTVALAFATDATFDHVSHMATAATLHPSTSLNGLRIVRVFRIDAQKTLIGQTTLGMKRTMAIPTGACESEIGNNSGTFATIWVRVCDVHHQLGLSINFVL